MVLGTDDGEKEGVAVGTDGALVGTADGYDVRDDDTENEHRDHESSPARVPNTNRCTVSVVIWVKSSLLH